MYHIWSCLPNYIHELVESLCRPAIGPMISKPSPIRMPKLDEIDQLWAPKIENLIWRHRQDHHVYILSHSKDWPQTCHSHPSYFSYLFRITYIKRPLKQRQSFLPASFCTFLLLPHLKPRSRLSTRLGRRKKGYNLRCAKGIEVNVWKCMKHSWNERNF